MYMELLCKAHFDKEGGLSGFPFMDELEELAGKEQVSAKRYFYKMLGYKDTDKFGADEIFELRKLSSQGDYDKLSTKLKLKDKKEIDSVLKAVGALSERGKVRKPSGPKVVPEGLVRLLAKYFRENEEKSLTLGNDQFLFSSYLKEISLKKSVKEVKEFLSSASTKSITMAVTPQLVYRPKTIPTISQGVFFVDVNLSKTQALQLVEEAVKHAALQSLDVPEAVSLFVKQNGAFYHLVDKNVYLKFVDYSHALGMTIKELIESVGMSFVDRIEYFTNHKVIPYQIKANSFRFYSATSNSSDKFVDLEKDQIKALLDTQALETLAWDEKGAYVFLGGKYYLSGEGE